MKILYKLDNWLFKICERMILKRVKKSKFKKHKYHIRQEWDRFEITGLCAAMLLEVFLKIFSHKVTGAIVIIAIWVPLIALKLYTKRNDKMIEIYDQLWMLRKHPEVYAMTKEMCERWREEDRGIRTKGLALFISMALLMTFLMGLATFSPINLWVIFSMWFATIHVQIRYVFDFDPPDKEEKKSDSKLTDLVQKQLDKLFKQFVPSPL